MEWPNVWIGGDTFQANDANDLPSRDAYEGFLSFAATSRSTAGYERFARSWSRRQPRDCTLPNFDARVTDEPAVFGSQPPEVSAHAYLLTDLLTPSTYLLTYLHTYLPPEVSAHAYLLTDLLAPSTYLPTYLLTYLPPEVSAHAYLLTY